jgi:hypothetical protein
MHHLNPNQNQSTIQQINYNYYNFNPQLQTTCQQATHVQSHATPQPYSLYQQNPMHQQQILSDDHPHPNLYSSSSFDSSSVPAPVHGHPSQLNESCPALRTLRTRMLQQFKHQKQIEQMERNSGITIPLQYSSIHSTEQNELNENKTFHSSDIDVNLHHHYLSSPSFEQTMESFTPNQQINDLLSFSDHINLNPNEPIDLSTENDCSSFLSPIDPNYYYSTSAIIPAQLASSTTSDQNKLISTLPAVEFSIERPKPILKPNNKTQTSNATQDKTNELDHTKTGDNQPNKSIPSKKKSNSSTINCSPSRLTASELSTHPPCVSTWISLQQVFAELGQLSAQTDGNNYSIKHIVSILDLTCCFSICSAV